MILSLIALTQDENGLPRWHSSPHLSNPADDFMLQQYPNGYLNCGLAHGVPGIIGALALAHLEGIRCPGMEEAIDRLAAWLTNHRLDDEWGINWPGGIGLRRPGDPAGLVCPVEASNWRRRDGATAAPAWPGFCIFRVNASKDEYCDLAVQTIQDVLRRPPAVRRIESPTFCHGVAGLLQIVLRFANDTASPILQAGAAALTEQLLELYEPESLLGFRSIEFAGKRVDQPGLLDGRRAALVLLAAASDVNPAWDRIFLLS